MVRTEDCASDTRSHGWIMGCQINSRVGKTKWEWGREHKVGWMDGELGKKANQEDGESFGSADKRGT
ncbi:hypothetical protein GOP47_0024435 [Adiantum capillus-veneris]|uniref:Uncharacterized protein n=1 Tax=Adiantum capillus-veneris TaxID=13818 RepID=A0A9D4U302_ADICA|nr:hypothetical protein GOP47_0024435 [Adiantum capillus-veneris]